MRIILTVHMVILLSFMSLVVYLFIHKRPHVKKSLFLFFSVLFFSVLVVSLINYFENKINDNIIIQKNRIIAECLVNSNPNIAHADVKVQDEMDILKVNIVLRLSLNIDSLEINRIANLVIDNLEGLDEKNIFIISQNGDVLYPIQ